MINKESVAVTQNQEIVISKQCDRCKKVFFPTNNTEFQEFLHICVEGGCGSVWGDGIKMQVDLCQMCGHEMFKDIARVEDMHGVPPGMP